VDVDRYEALFDDVHMMSMPVTIRLVVVDDRLFVVVPL
jgi:hypothetical protein